MNSGIDDGFVLGGAVSGWRTLARHGIPSPVSDRVRMIIIPTVSQNGCCRSEFQMRRGRNLDVVGNGFTDAKPRFEQRSPKLLRFVGDGRESTTALGGKATIRFQADQAEAGYSTRSPGLTVCRTAALSTGTR
jgi:hypothetical protein